MCSKCGSNNILIADSLLSSTHTCIDCGNSVTVKSWLAYSDEEKEKEIDEMINRLVMEQEDPEGYEKMIASEKEEIMKKLNQLSNKIEGDY